MALSNSTRVVRRQYTPGCAAAAGFDALGPSDGAHLRAGIVFGELDLIVLGRPGEALPGAPEALHDLGHILGAARLAQAGLQLEQHGLEAGGFGRINGAVLLLARG